MDVSLTKESRHALKEIYRIYAERRKEGMQKSLAVRFKDSPGSDRLAIDGLSDCKQELSKAGFLRSFITGDFDLTDKAIIFMENLTKESLLKWLEVGVSFLT